VLGGKKATPVMRGVFPKKELPSFSGGGISREWFLVEKGGETAEKNKDWNEGGGVSREWLFFLRKKTQPV